MEKQSIKYFLVCFSELFVNGIWLYPGYKGLSAILGNPKLSLLFLVVGYLIWFFSIIARYFIVRYNITDNYIRISYGIFNIDTITLNKSEWNITVSNYRIEENMYQKIFNTKGLILYLTSNSDREHIRIRSLSTDSLKRIELFLSNISSYQNNNNDNVFKSIPLAKVKIDNIIKTALFSLNYIVVILFLMDFQEFREQFFSNIPFNFNPSVITYLFIFLTVVLAAIGIQYFRFSKFELLQNGSNFVVQNGIISNDKNIFEATSIKGIDIDMGIGKRLFNLISISGIFVNEFQRDSLSKNYLFPIVPKEELPVIIEKYIPHIPLKIFDGEKVIGRTKTKVIYGILVLVASVISIITLSIFLEYKATGITLLIILFLFGQRIFSPMVTSLSIGNGFIIIYTGLINKKIQIFPTDMVSSIKETNFLDISITSITFQTLSGLGL